MTDARADFEALTAEKVAEVHRIVESLRGLGPRSSILAILGTVIEWGDEARLHESRRNWDEMRAMLVAVMEKVRPR